MDASELENKYFIDAKRYNCAFCKVRSVGFVTTNLISFDWTDEKQAYAYFVKCLNCEKISIHLSYFLFSYDSDYPDDTFIHPPRKRVAAGNLPVIVCISPNGEQRENEGFYNKGEILDDYFFYHHPTSAFSVNPDVPPKIKDLIDEAEGCRKQNFLVGASGALRKAIYEFLLDQKVIGEHYEDRIKALKTKYPKAEEEIFDALAGIQDLTSNALHEDELGNWEPWKIKDFNYVMFVFTAAMYEVYSSPKKSKTWLQGINRIKNPAKK